MLGRLGGGFGLFLTALLVAPSATAQRAEITQHVFDDDGLPVLVANPVPDGGRGEVVAWRMCAPAVECQPVATDGDDDRSIEPGDVPASRRVSPRPRNGGSRRHSSRSS